MAEHTRISSPGDREGITDLMRRAFGHELSPISIDPGFQRWKYWDKHPFMASGRSYLLNGKERIVGHACRWPMRILTPGSTFDAFHLIDWAADSSHAGAGLQVLRDSFENAAALFSIGGSPTTRRMLPALGEHLSRRATQGKAVSYTTAGQVFFLNRVLKVVAPALRESPLGWRTPARVAKNALLSVLPIPRLPAGYSYEQVALKDIPQELWPRPGSAVAVTARTPELMQHFESCPVLQRPMYFLVSRQRSIIAYFLLVLAGGLVRLADFGPAALDESAAAVVGTAAQLAAKRYYPEALRIATVTSELAVRSGFLLSGFRQSYEEEIRGLIADPALQPVKQYRLTYLDCDAVSM
jgi:Acetyltransferase (GNAT) domain